MAAQVLKFDGLVFENTSYAFIPIFLGGLKFEQQTIIYEQFTFRGIFFEWLNINDSNALFAFSGL